MDTDGIASSESETRVHVRFLTKLQPPWKLPANSIAVPSFLTRMGLSELVNELLKQTNSEHEHQPFDFLIDGEFVRMSLEQFLLAKEITTEKVLEIEYIKAIAPREEQDPLLHDDWVSAVDGSDPRFILTGCYDNISRIWKTGTFCSHILEGHTSAVTSVCILNTKGIENGDIRLATGSKDRTLRLWMFDSSENVDRLMRIRPYKVLNGHTASVQSISSAPSGDMVCSGSWDCSVKLWNVKDSVAEGDFVSVKKRRLVSDTAEESQSECSHWWQPVIEHCVCVASTVSTLWAGEMMTWPVRSFHGFLHLI